MSLREMYAKCGCLFCQGALDLPDDGLEELDTRMFEATTGLETKENHLSKCMALLAEVKQKYNAGGEG